jgi:putative oxidoreductase
MQSLGLLILRLITGGIFIVHGYPKLFGGPGKLEKLHPAVRRHLGPRFEQAMETGSIAGFRASVERTGVPVPGPMTWASVLSQFGGGILIVLGWHTRLAAAITGMNMVVAISRVHWGKGLMGGYEFALLLLGSLVTFILSGPGAISIDGD